MKSRNPAFAEHYRPSSPIGRAAELYNSNRRALQQYQQRLHDHRRHQRQTRADQLMAGYAQRHPQHDT